MLVRWSNSSLSNRLRVLGRCCERELLDLALYDLCRSLTPLLIDRQYSSGSVLVVPFSPTPPHLLPPKQSLITFDGSGPNPDRQESSHPHQIIFHPTREELLIPDLGADKIWRCLKNNSGAWEVKGSVSMEAGSGPRHAVIHSKS
jgi:6-phosphogluconolactonase (cycloisomerase 2 family)